MNEFSPATPRPRTLKARLRPTPQTLMVLIIAAGAASIVTVLHISGPLFALRGTLGSWAAITIAIVFQALPFLVLGIIVSSTISALIPQSFLRAITPSDEFAAVPISGAAGLLLPGCECASVPVTHSLMRRGLPPAAAFTFLLASPAINPVVLVSTAVAFNGYPLMVWARLAASLIAAIVVGWLWIAFGRNDVIRSADTTHDAHGSKWEEFREAAFHDLLNTGGFLVFGAMAAAAMKVLVPQSWFTALERFPFATIAVMALLAIVLSLCSEADAFVAASFTQVSPTAQLVFLVVGPMVDLKLIAMQVGTWGGRFAARFIPLVLLVSVFSAVMIGGILFS